MMREFYVIDRHVFDERRLTDSLGPLLEDDTHGQVWLIEPDAGPAGYAIVTWGYSVESGGRDALLDEIYVRDRGRGLGGQALEEIVAVCQALGCSRMFLETEAPNERVRSLYLRHGFDIEPSIWMSRDFDPPPGGR